jgi:ABC-2 type transport system ATP-binding protein
MLVCLEHIQKSFTSGFLMRRKAVLEDLSLGIESGDAYALLGSNGAGKSTTLRVLLGLTRPDSGSGELFGQPLGDHQARHRLGYLPENPSFHEQLTADEFMRYCGGLLGLRGAQLTRRIDELLTRVQLEQARSTRLRKMSKGMMQRIGLAQALLGDPELLILDEPMSGLDPPGRKLVRDLILEQCRQGKTVLFSTHILSDAEVVCTRAGILRAGRIASEIRLDDLGSLRSDSVEVTLSALSAESISELEPLAHSTVQLSGGVLFNVAPGEPVHRLVQMGLAFGGRLESVAPRRVSLEDMYIHVNQAEVARTPTGSPRGSGSELAQEAVGERR